jgi:hypothetical protein
MKYIVLVIGECYSEENMEKRAMKGSGFDPFIRKGRDNSDQGLT